MMTKAVHILHILSEFNMGGIEKLLLQFLEASKKSEGLHYTTVILNNDVDPAMQRELQSIGYPVYFFNKLRSQRHLKYFVQLFKILTKHKIQIIHAHNHGAKYWALLCKLFLPYLKIVYTIHDTNYRFQPIDSWIHRHLININVAISQSVQKEWLYKKINNITVIYNGIDTKKFSWNQSSDFSENGSPQQTHFLRIIQIARILPEKKGQDLLIRALQYCQEEGIPFHCNFVGGVSPDKETSLSELQQLAEACQIHQRISFLGKRNDIPDLLQESNLFVLPSRYEGFGLAVVEAMAAKIPVIVSDIDGPAELIQDGCNGFIFQSDDPKALFEKIKWCYLNPDLVKQVIMRAHQDSFRFDILNMVQHYFDLYHHLNRERFYRY